MFKATTAGQMAAFFADKQGAPISVMKLIKLMYLADREAMRLYGRPISFDTMVSMKHGPVLSQTLDLINGLVDGTEGAAWDYWISGRDKHEVALRRHFNRNDLDYLSNADIEVLELVWKKFGHMDQWQVRDYTHAHCREWQDPTGMEKQSIPIEAIDVFKAVGIKAKEAVELAHDLEVEKSLHATLSQP